MLTFKKWLEMVGTGAIVPNCKGKKDSFLVQGACSDLKKPKKKK